MLTAFIMIMLAVTSVYLGLFMIALSITVLGLLIRAGASMAALFVCGFVLISVCMMI